MNLARSIFGFGPFLLVTVLVALLAATDSRARPPHGQHAWPPPTEYHRLEHPQHRLAYWYANESMRQAQEAREMVCGFAGQRWTLDWEVHYRWALRAAPRRVYQRVEERDRHLTTCRSRKLRDYQRQPYRRDPDGYGRG
ncbi:MULTISPECIES: hypothetical protein [unclassified Wenzhouxiangella]|uniref:hypothetical protein n=1 Tax=unclassified Wenzhouxiangella TaxID=2613841 RepID=UPI000E32838F|nr:MULTISPECIES: hypothetical protein [unclassified Wenzhouxiangella]RFF27408.1 hypothetical protein DZK25_08385 [Wenzhouxiangella sp. 15181]RFP68836.1 hypothetical protein DZK26_06830 [Wenzhouxiangella sp. 15190]